MNEFTNRSAATCGRRIALPVAAVLCLLLVGCATPRTKLPPGTFPVAGALPVEMYVGQQEIVIDAQQTNAMAAGGGLIGALIVSAIDNVAGSRDERRMGPIRDRLVDFDMRTLMQRELEEGLVAAQLAERLEFEAIPETRIALLGRNELRSRPKVLSIDADYALGYDLRSLRVTFDARYGNRTIDGKRDRSKPIRTSRVTHVVSLPDDHARMKEDELAGLWAALGTESLKSMLAAGVDDAVAMLAYDLQTNEAPDTGEKLRFGHGAQAFGSGRVVRDLGDRQWVRTGMELISMPKGKSIPSERE
ncbi:MAG: hypothetical protein ABIP49_10710 [Lysobacterales bacterium]